MPKLRARKLILSLLLMLGGWASAQTVTIISVGDTLQKPKYAEFIYLNDSTDTSSSVPVATISANGSLKDPVMLYSNIRKQAQRYGANGFRFNNFKRIDTETGELTLDLFHCSDSLLGENFLKLSKSRAYVLGDGDMTQESTQSFKADGKKYLLKSGHYMVFPVAQEAEFRISKGGFTGMTRFYKGGAEKNAVFYSFSGFGIVGANYMASGAGQGVGVNFTTGTIHKIDESIGQLLLKIFSEQ
ncbi:MAG TPA: hypothetical protein VGB50_05655 [Flavobacterium sp.]|jgi:hypothetical protein